MSINDCRDRSRGGRRGRDSKGNRRSEIFLISDLLSQIAFYFSLHLSLGNQLWIFIEVKAREKFERKDERTRNVLNFRAQFRAAKPWWYQIPGAVRRGFGRVSCPVPTPPGVGRTSP